MIFSRNVGFSSNLERHLLGVVVRQDVCIDDAGQKEVDPKEKKHWISLTVWNCVNYKRRSYCNQGCSCHTRKSYHFFPTWSAQLSRIGPSHRGKACSNDEHEHADGRKAKSLILKDGGDSEGHVQYQGSYSGDG